MMRASSRLRGARPGIALPAALALLTLLGLLTVGAVVTTALTQRAARLRQNDDLLSATADFAATTVIASPDSFGLAALPFGLTRTFTVQSPQPDRIAVGVTVTRLPAQVLWITASATLTGPESGQRRSAMIALFPSPGPTPPAALVTPGQVALGDSVVVAVDSGGDPDCRDATQVAHPTDTASYYLTASQLALLDSSPVVHHVRGDTTIAGGSFSGLLIVDGNAFVTGDFFINGLLIARGRIDVAGSIAANGALMAFASGSSAIHITAGFVRYAPCPIGQVFRTLRPPRPVRRRNWLELF